MKSEIRNQRSEDRDLLAELTAIQNPHSESDFLESAMKNPPNTSTLSGEHTATSDVLPPNGGKSPLPPATFLEKDEGRSMKDEKMTDEGSEHRLLKKPLLAAETFNQLWTLYSETHMAGVFGGLNDAYSAQGVQAGIVATLLAVLPEEQFREVMIRWEVDAIRLTQLLHVAGVWTAASAKGDAAGKIATPLESSAPP